METDSFCLSDVNKVFWWCFCFHLSSCFCHQSMCLTNALHVCKAAHKSCPSLIQPVNHFTTTSFFLFIFFHCCTFSLTIISVKLSNELRRGPVLKLWMADTQNWACASSFWCCPLPPLSSSLSQSSPSGVSFQTKPAAFWESQFFLDLVVLVGQTVLPATIS